MKKIASILPFALTGALLAWNGTGHKAIALIAYQRLTPAAKHHVDELLAKHPDYPRWIAGIAAVNRGRAAFA